MTVAIYGIPIMEDGMKLDLESKKIEDLDPPAPTYEEDQTLQPGVEVQKSAGTKGSRWETYKVIYKDGVEVSRELDHKTTYKGHVPVILRNTSGVVLAPEETTVPDETPIPTVDGMPDGYVPGSDPTISSPDGSAPENGPGITPTVPSATTAPTVPSTPGTQAPGPGTAPGTSDGPGGGNPVIAPLNQN